MMKLFLFYVIHSQAIGFTHPFISRNIGRDTIITVVMKIIVMCVIISE